MTLLQISEKIRDHLIKQRSKSQSEYGSCKYRNDEGLMCAVGCLITDEAYDEGLEGKMSDDLLVTAALERSGVQVDETGDKLFRAWQSYHDSSYFSNDVESNAGYCYGIWVADTETESHSPAVFHEMILKELSI